MQIPTTTAQKIETRILAELQKGAPTMREAAERAAWRSCEEGREKGWPETQIIGMTAAFAQVAADMLARTLEETGR